VSLHPTPLSPRPPVEPTRSFRLGLSAWLFLAAAVGLGLTLAIAPRESGFFAAVPAGLIGVVACELYARGKTDTAEPWRYDGYCVLLGTLAIFSLGLTVGPEASLLGWVLALLLASLGLATVLPGS